MNCSRIIGTSLLTCAAMLVSSEGNAQPHMPPRPWQDPIGPTPEPDVWLRRLAGKYSFDGVACASECSGIEGKGDCIAVGAGPGVQCVLNVTWHERWNMGEPLLLSILDPSMALFGLDPGKSAINMLLVDNRGLPRGGLGFVRGNLATFKTCLYEGGDCQQIVRIEAKADARLLYMWIDGNMFLRDHSWVQGNIMLSLRRAPPDKQSDAPAK